MNHPETESGAIREIEPEIRTLFTKVVERDPREAAKMLEPYPDEFVVDMQKVGAYMADIMPAVQAEIMKAAAKMNH